MDSLSYTGHDGHLLFAGKRAIAWYWIPPIRWNWRSDTEREQMITLSAQRYSALVGSRLYWRGLPRPISPANWKQYEPNPRALPGFQELQQRGESTITSHDLSEKETFLGVRITRPPSRKVRWWKAATLEKNQLRDRVERIDDIVTGPGWDGRPITTEELEWLMNRSCALGFLPEDGGDIDEAIDRAHWSITPYGRMTKIVTEIRGIQQARYVVVVTLGKMSSLQMSDPWLSRTDRLPFPVDLSACIDIIPHEKALKKIEKAILRIGFQSEHYGEVGRKAKLSLGSAERDALIAQEEIESGLDGLSTRTEGWFRIAVSGKSEQEVEKKVQAIKDLYFPKIRIARPNGTGGERLIGGQYDLAKEFIPGEELSSIAFCRRMPVDALGAAMPNMTARVGHPPGPPTSFYIGYTVGQGGKHSVHWDLWRSQEGRGPRGSRSGLTLISGIPGSGKSTALGVITFDAAMSGATCTVLDPSGPLSRLCYLPELAPYSQHIDLLSAAPGILNPWKIIATPARDRFDSDEAWEHAVEMAQQLRRTLCVDVLSMLLPATLAVHEDTPVALLAAAMTVEDGPRASPRQVLNILQAGSYRDIEDPEVIRHGQKLALFLGEMAKLSATQLIFPSGIGGLDYIHREQPSRLTVISMRGLTLPKVGVKREFWNTNEQVSQPLLHLAALKVSQAMYLGDLNEQKFVGIDEGNSLTTTSSGQLLLNTGSRDSRKHNTRFVISSQNTSDHNRAEVGNLLDSCFGGRTENFQDQQDLLEILRIPTGIGYEKGLGNLSQDPSRKEFLFNDGEGGLEKIVFDIEHLPEEVRKALDTTADSTKVSA